MEEALPAASGGKCLAQWEWIGGFLAAAQDLTLFQVGLAQVMDLLHSSGAEQAYKGQSRGVKQSTLDSESQGPEFQSQWDCPLAVQSLPAIPSRQISDAQQGQPRQYRRL
ncbi:hypothetical protein WISP_69992 [Willisornis vidua]|uniref:Uncharacterized protein n=1 Tax=Willisornis vidua TaxID=1566151 RepID=A0ABQ9DDP3_9PASS|nr:hypothetical protein WISP_69992 [Willisornis vidua]